MSESAAQFRRMRDALAVGNALSPGDAAALHLALVMAEKNGTSIERGLKWPARWRVDVRISDVLDALSDLCVGENFSDDARSIRLNTDAMRRLTVANRGKPPCWRVLRRWLSDLAKLSH
jgi:hypothetical protein